DRPGLGIRAVEALRLGLVDQLAGRLAGLFLDVVEVGLKGHDRFLLRGGYLGTSVDEIAARAKVAKQTVYEHFGGKEALFNEIVLRTIDQVGEPFFELSAEVDDVDDVESSLRDLARRLVRVVREPRLIELRRLVIGEVGRFPKLGRVFVQRGP